MLSARRGSGELEAEVLAVLWAADEPVTPEELRGRLGSGLAYTTVTTILARLHEKGAVAREPHGRGYCYFPLLDQQGLTAPRMRALLDGHSDHAGVLSRFVDSLDAATLAALRRAVGPKTGRVRE